MDSSAGPARAGEVGRVRGLVAPIPRDAQNRGQGMVPDMGASKSEHTFPPTLICTKKRNLSWYL